MYIYIYIYMYICIHQMYSRQLGLTCKVTSRTKLAQIRCRQARLT